MTVNVFSPTADGIIAALLAPFFLSLGFFIWDHRWTSSGASAFALNMYKCNVASIGFVAMCLARGFAIPDYNNSSSSSNNSTSSSEVFTSTSVGYLILSSTLGIIVGDVLWLEALRLLGAKHVIVIDSLKPFMAAVLGRVALEEVLRPPAWGGMVLTVVGVGVVAWEEQRSLPQKQEVDSDGNNDIEVVEKSIEQTEAMDNGVDFNNEEDGEINTDIVNDDFVDQQSPANATSSTSKTEQTKYKRGYACAIINVLADSLGSLLTKKYGAGMTTWSINLIRFGFAGVVLICISIGMRLRRRRCWRSNETMEKASEVALNNDVTNNANPDLIAGDDDESKSPPLWFELPALSRMGWLQITAGVGLVTFLCPALSNYALFQIALGLAVSLSSIGPLYGLFMDWPFKGRRPTLVGCVGVLLTVAGVVILCVWGT